MAMAMADESSSVSMPSSAAAATTTTTTTTSSSSSSFFACYLLHSLNPRFRSSTYIGFTVNPKRRIRQHNGEISSGARKTKKKRPWEMILCVYGFPSNIHALQFEWAWQHPFQSVAVREAASILKLARGSSGKVMLLYTMLNLPEWKSLPLTVNILSTKHLPLTKGCPSLPSHMHVKVGTLDELPFHRIDFQASDEHENGSDCDSLDDDEDDDGAKENGYQCLKSTISHNGHCQYATTKCGSLHENSCMPSNVLAEISNTIAHFSCDEPSEKPKRQGSSKPSKPDSKGVKCVPKSSQFSRNGVMNGRSGQLRTRESSKSTEFSCSLSRISSQEEYESNSVPQKGNQSHSTELLFSSRKGLEEPLPDKTLYFLQKDHHQHSTEALHVSREDHATSLSYNTYDISCMTNNVVLDTSQFSPLWSPSPAPANDSNRVMRGIDILSEDSMRKVTCSLSFSPLWRSRSIHLGDVFSSHSFDEAIPEDGKCSTGLFHSISTDSPLCHKKPTTVSLQEFLPVRKQPIVIDLTDSPISK